MNNFVLIMLSLFLISCSNIAPVTEIKVNYDPYNEARIRLYGQNNYSTNISNSEISKQVGGIRANKLGGVLKEIFTPLKSISIGMPKTELIDNLAKSRSSIIAGLYYEEYVVPANKEYSIYTSYRDGGTGPVITTCNVQGKVYLENNSDYEVFADIKNNKCIISVYKINSTGNYITSERILIKQTN